MHPTLSSLPALGRILLAMIFVVSGIGKLGAIATTSAHMASAGIPYSDDLVWGAVALELGGGMHADRGIFDAARRRCLLFLYAGACGDLPSPTGR